MNERVHQAFAGVMECISGERIAELKRHGSTRDERVSSIIAAAIKSGSLTCHEMGQILGAITDRICRMSTDNPEFEETANDLAESCENYAQAEDKRDERLCDANWPTKEHLEEMKIGNEE